MKVFLLNKALLAFTLFLLSFTVLSQAQPTGGKDKTTASKDKSATSKDISAASEKSVKTEKPDKPSDHESASKSAADRCFESGGKGYIVGGVSGGIVGAGLGYASSGPLGAAAGFSKGFDAGSKLGATIGCGSGIINTSTSKGKTQNCQLDDDSSKYDYTKN